MLSECSARRTPSRRAALLTNPTAVTKDLTHAVDALHEHPNVDLRLLLGPEHGVRATAQDMITVGDELDPIHESCRLSVSMERPLNLSHLLQNLLRGSMS